MGKDCGKVHSMLAFPSLFGHSPFTLYPYHRRSTHSVGRLGGLRWRYSCRHCSSNWRPSRSSWPSCGWSVGSVPAPPKPNQLGGSSRRHDPGGRPVGAENLIWLADQGRCTRKNVGTCRATYVPNSVAPAVRQDPDGDLEILVSNPIGVFGTHRQEMRSGGSIVRKISQLAAPAGIDVHIIARRDTRSVTTEPSGVLEDI